MTELKMIPCPKCGDDFPELRKTKYNYHVCVNCSTVEPLVGVTTVEGTGDHTYNDLIIMPQEQFRAISNAAAELEGKRVHFESLDIDTTADLNENEVSQSIKESVKKLVGDDEEEEELIDPENDSRPKMRGIDY